MNTSNKIETFFKKYFPFNTEGINELLNSFEFKTIKKGEIILKPSKVEKELKFINSGLIREYYTKDSKEININFYGKTEFPTDIYSFYNATKTKKWQECLTEVEIQTLSKDKFDSLLKKYSCGNAIVYQSMQNFIRAKDTLEYNRTTKDTKELYKEILLKKSDWLKHIPQYHIASYLNITPETLSRIRKRIS